MQVLVLYVVLTVHVKPSFPDHDRDGLSELRKGEVILSCEWGRGLP